MNETTPHVSSPQVNSPEEKARWSDLGLFNITTLLIIGTLLCYIFRHQIEWIINRWDTDKSWSHGYLIPFFSLYFLNQKKQDILQQHFKPNYLGLILLVGCLIFYPLNIVHFHVAYFKSLTILASIGSTVLFLGGWKLVRYTWLPIAYLLFAMPLPYRLYRDMTFPLQRFSTDVATAALNLIPNLSAEANGVVIDVVYKGQTLDPGLNVAEACSGMRLLMAFLALGVAMAYLHERPIWQRVILLISTIPIAILCNFIRVTTTCFIYILWDPQYAQGIYHDMLGIAMLPIAFGLYGLLAWFMGNLFVEQADHKEEVIIRSGGTQS